MATIQKTRFVSVPASRRALRFEARGSRLGGQRRAVGRRIRRTAVVGSADIGRVVIGFQRGQFVPLVDWLGNGKQALDALGGTPPTRLALADFVARLHLAGGSRVAELRRRNRPDQLRATPDVSVDHGRQYPVKHLVASAWTTAARQSC